MDTSPLKSTSSRPRRPTFVSSCSPDELLQQILGLVFPKYRIDAPRCLALRKLLLQTIVPSKQPSKLRAVRPDPCIGAVQSVYDTPRSYGPNGPPVICTQSFYFHHKDPEFAKLLPQVDLSTYEWPLESDSDGSEDSVQIDEPSELLHPGPKQDLYLKPPAIIATPSPIDREKTTSGRSYPCPKAKCGATAPDDEFERSPVDPQSLRRFLPRRATTTPEDSQNESTPTIIITDGSAQTRGSTRRNEPASTSVHALRATDVFGSLPDTGETHDDAEPTSTPPPPYTSQALETQKALPSTQQSKLCNSHVELSQDSPSTEEHLQDSPRPVEIVEEDEANLTSGRNIKVNTSTMSPQLSSRSSVPLQSLSFTNCLGKRSHEVLSGDVDSPLRKRSKSLQ